MTPLQIRILGAMNQEEGFSQLVPTREMAPHFGVPAQVFYRVTTLVELTAAAVTK